MKAPRIKISGVPKLGVPFMGVPTIRSIVYLVYTGFPDFGKLPHWHV